MKKLLFSMLICATSVSAQAANLLQVYQQALRSDPIYQNAIATYKDQREALPQSLATLQPSASLVLNTTFTRNKPRIDGPGLQTTRFNSHGYQLSLSQPIFNYANWAQVASARNSVRSAYATLLAARQDLMTRVANAYFNVLLAQDNLRFTLSEKRFIAQQLEQTQQRFRVGLDAITSVYDARASYDAIIATEIKARNNLNNSREALREITGTLYTHLSGLKNHIPLVTPRPNNVSDWVKQSEQHNYSILAARYTALAARDNIQIQFAGHLPTLDAVGSYTYTNSHDPSRITSGQGGSATVGALELNIPIYSGGAVTSLTRQARYQYLEAVTTLETTHRTVISSLRQTYNSIMAGISQIRADRQAIVSRQASLKGTQAAFKVGTRTIVDVLNDQKELTQAQQQYAQDQYSYINNTLALKAATGRLCDEDLAMINSWLSKRLVKVSARTRSYHHLIDVKALPKTSADDTKAHTKNKTKEKPAKQSSHNSVKKKELTKVKKSLAKLNNKPQANQAAKTPSQQAMVSHPTAKHTSDAHKAYTIQLYAAKSPKEAQGFITRHKLNKIASYQPGFSQNQQWYDVLIGHYSSVKQAKDAMKQLAPKLKQIKPWIKPL